MSSKMTTNTRPRPIFASVFEEIRGRGGGSSAASAGPVASKLMIAWGTSSSVTTRSSIVIPETGLPFLSVTTRSTMTCSIRPANVGGAS